jgi:hypothetical protein
METNVTTPIPELRAVPDYLAIVLTIAPWITKVIIDTIEYIN